MEAYIKRRLEGDVHGRRDSAPFIPKLGKCLVKTPKVYICDTGLTCALLGIKSFDDLYAHPVFGGCWEQMVLVNIRRLYPDADVSFYRTAGGAEMDFVVTRQGKTVALECKASTAPSVTKGTYSVLDAIRPDAAYVVAPMNEAYALNDRITAIPLSVSKTFWHEGKTIANSPSHP